MNYTQLINAVQATLENTFPATDTAAGAQSYTSADQLALFVQQAEQRIYNTVQFPALRKNVTGAVTANSPYLDMPADFLAVYSLAVVDANGVYSYLINKDVNFIREAYPDPSATGAPKYYALFGPTVLSAPSLQLTEELSAILGPTPDDAYTAQLHYFFYPESIVTAGNTWLGDNLDSVLLAATVLEAALFMKAEQDLMQAYLMRYQEALQMAKRMGDGMQRGDAYRNGQFKAPVT